MTVVWQLLACVGWFVYTSFFEWFIHGQFMHRRRVPFHDAFRGHAQAHHQIYKGETYQKEEPGRPNDVLMRWYALPSLLLAHAPLFWAVEQLTGIPSFWGGIAGFTLYSVGYEYTHYLMHIPRQHPVERTRFFQFTQNHHRLHHKYMLKNLNVFVPIADYCLGTLIVGRGEAGPALFRRRDGKAARQGARG